MNSKTKITLLLCFFSVFVSNAQSASDSIVDKQIDSLQLKFKYKSLIIPAVFIGYGIIGLESGQIKGFNAGISNEVTEDIDEKTSIDDFSQYTPVFSLYALSALGVKSKNNFKDKTIVLVTSYLLMGLTVNAFKQTASVERPDGTSLNSFPSGHTATAFMGAELMMQEFKDESVWYGISGYVVATGTGLFRMYNNRHWLSDVVAGAGIGIVSAKAGYWLFPYVSKIFKSNKNKKSQAIFVPNYNGKQMGFGLYSKF
jgi:hypothetical protein